MANDSDVDGILDGLEVNGSYCFATEVGCTPFAVNNATRTLDPLNPDTDGDQLRDGQEVAGWKVATWREHTMEAIANWSVVSYPWDPDSEADGNTDFVEFQNGSDPFLADTDGDGYSDYDEATQPGANVTGWHNRPPRIENWNVVKYVADGSLPLFGSGHWVVQVDFDAWALHGIGRWEVSWGTPQLNESDQAELDALFAGHGDGVFLSCANSILGANADLCNAMKEILSRGPVTGATVVGNAGGNATAHIVAQFDATVEEAHIAGKWVEALLWDVYGLGVSKKVQVKSTLEVILDFLAAVASAVAEAASFLLQLILDAVKWLVKAVFDAISEATEPLFRNVRNAFAHALLLPIVGFLDPSQGGVEPKATSSRTLVAAISPIMGISLLPAIVLIIAGVLLKIFTNVAGEVADRATGPMLRQLFMAILIAGAVFLGADAIRTAIQSSNMDTLLGVFGHPEWSVLQQVSGSIAFVASSTIETIVLFQPGLLAIEETGGRTFLAMTLSVFALLFAAAQTYHVVANWFDAAISFAMIGISIGLDILALIALVPEVVKWYYGLIPVWYEGIMGLLTFANVFGTAFGALDSFVALLNTRIEDQQIDLQGAVSATFLTALAVASIGWTMLPGGVL